MLVVGVVPKSLMRRLVNKCVTHRSQSNCPNLLFCKVVKENLMNASPLLSEEEERGSFRLNPLISKYMRFDVGPTVYHVYQDTALRAAYEAVLQKQVEQLSTAVDRRR